jgi:PAS domain S-box-containing protein
MRYGLKLLCLLLLLGIVGGILRQLWHPYRSPRWTRAWSFALVGTIGMVGYRVYYLWADEPLLDLVVTLVVGSCALMALWEFVQLFEAELLPPPPMPYGHIQIDSTSTILAWDRMAEQIFGYAAAEVVGHSLYDPATSILPAAAREAHQQGMARYLADPSTTRILGHWVPQQARHKNGILFTVELLINVQPATDPPTFTAQVRQVFTL